MSAARQRKAQACRIGLKIESDYRALVEAVGEEQVQIAAIKLGDTFNSNIEFIINVLRDYGGLQAKFEPMTKTSPSAPPAANDVPVTPAIFMNGAE